MISPSGFFEVKGKILKAAKTLTSKHLLPDTHELTGDLPLKVYAGWSDEALLFKVPGEVKTIELFIDTRDVKSSGYTTKFCHHFYFSHSGCEERTKFRTDDSHLLCNPTLLSYKDGMITIPKAALTGYDPATFTRIGLQYRIDGEVHFTAHSDEFSIVDRPATWASMELVD